VLRSPGEGRVMDVLVGLGTTVVIGQELVVIESMKMEIPVAAEQPGTVAAIAVAPGDLVHEGDILLTLSA
jgi:acetyl-CoA carboxylase biotin carboxyl carrier protein